MSILQPFYQSYIYIDQMSVLQYFIAGLKTYEVSQICKATNTYFYYFHRFVQTMEKVFAEATTVVVFSTSMIIGIAVLKTVEVS